MDPPQDSKRGGGNELMVTVDKMVFVLHVSAVELVCLTVRCRLQL